MLIAERVNDELKCLLDEWSLTVHHDVDVSWPNRHNPKLCCMLGRMTHIFRILACQESYRVLPTLL